jgi:hypothetical protein
VARRTYFHYNIPPPIFSIRRLKRLALRLA